MEIIRFLTQAHESPPAESGPGKQYLQVIAKGRSGLMRVSPFPVPMLDLPPIHIGPATAGNIPW